MTGKEEDKKIEEYENVNYYLLWWSDKEHFPYDCLGLSDEDNEVSRTDNFVNVNVFNSVTSPRVLSYRCVLHYFLTMPEGFNFNLTFRLKPKVGGIKRCHCLQTIHFSSWMAHSHYDHSYLVRRWSQTPNHRGQQTQGELFRELDKTLYCVWLELNYFAMASAYLFWKIFIRIANFFQGSLVKQI